MASSRTRIYQYLPYLHKAGIETKIINYVSEKHCRRNIEMAKRGFFGKIADKIFSWRQTVKILFFAPRYDILFIQKVLLASPILSLLKKLNNNIVFDFDDAIHSSVNEAFLKRFTHTLRISKCVIVENEQNKEYAERFNKNVNIITGPIDTSRYAAKPERGNSDKVTIGWIGSPEATEYIKPLTNVFKTLAERCGNLRITLIGSSGFNMDTTSLTLKEWKLDSEVKDLQDFDIGIMPLEDNAWTRGKGGYKLLQYMATGLPSVASPVGVNTKIIKDGTTGFLARSEDEWLDRLAILLEKKELREQMGRAGRARAETLFSYEASLPKFLDIIKKCLSTQMVNIELNPAVRGDCKKLFLWKNHPTVRKNSFNIKNISWKEHKKWFYSKVRDENAKIYIAKQGKNKIGVIRFQIMKDHIQVSVNLNPAFFGKGLGTKIIMFGTKKFLTDVKSDMSIIAEIKKNNIAAQNTFSKAGYGYVEEMPDKLLYRNTVEK